jgi:D-glycero-D-manno-heptose 1,7-bisphosphate phosphatase
VRGRRVNGLRPAAFLDRDGTIIRECRYLADPEGVELVPGAASALRTIAECGYALVVVTNQSGIARGLYAAADFRAVQQRVEDVLAGDGVFLDAVFHCPHHPDVDGPCECRKPGTGMHRAAAARLNLDLHGSVYVGDRIKDVLPAAELGGRGFLVRTGYGREEAPLAPAGVIVIDDLAELARIVAAEAAHRPGAARVDTPSGPE